MEREKFKKTMKAQGHWRDRKLIDTEPNSYIDRDDRGSVVIIERNTGYWVNGEPSTPPAYNHYSQSVKIKSLPECRLKKEDDDLYPGEHESVYSEDLKSTLSELYLDIVRLSDNRSHTNLKSEVETITKVISGILKNILHDHVTKKISHETLGGSRSFP